MSDKSNKGATEALVGETSSAFGCPKCGSTNVCGLVMAFWAAIEEDGSPKTRLMHLVESDTEIGTERMCSDCNHEWDEGDTPNVAGERPAAGKDA